MEEGRAFSELASEVKDLVEAAILAKSRAYCPYSNFRVGCAVVTDSGAIYSGCNVENASYGLTLCAERVALVKAVSEGHIKFKAAAVICDVAGRFVGPCGACRQSLAEFGLEWDIYLVKPDKTWKRITVQELLPLAFSPASLTEDRV